MTVPHKGTWRGGVWKLAPCLVAMEAEADRIAPRRRRTSDGSIGDANHAVRRSDHNPDEEGNTDWVDALDISHDPANGMDIHARLRVVARNVKNGVEKRVDYMISDEEIFSKRNGVWAWRPYNGTNPHTHHGHISVNDQYRYDTSPFFAGVPPFPTRPIPPPYIPVPEEDDMADAILRCPGRGVMHIVAGAINTLETAEVPLVEQSYAAQGLKVYRADISTRRWDQLAKQMD